jgi:outer membrane receptor for ferrienterochelin and colicins
MPRPALLALPAFLLAASPSGAQTSPPIPKVEVSAPSGADQRRNDSAGRLTVTREDIARFGDVNVSSLLKRQPGISVVNGEVRMRGLGAGYTQILIDGEPAPAGFAIDSLAPSMIERIDLMRNGSAEFGTQAIAGSINIIMRKNHAKPQRDLTLGAATMRGHLVNPSAALRWADQRGALAWSMGVELAEPEFLIDNSGYESDFDLEGRIVNDRIIRTRFGFASKKLALSPRLNWKLGGGDSLAWQATADQSKGRNAGCSSEIVLQGDATTYPDNCATLDLRIKSLRSDVTWIRTIGPGKLVTKAALNRFDRNTDYLFTGTGERATLARYVLSEVLDHSATLSGKYLAPLGDAHSLGLGWDGGRTLRKEFRNQRDTTADGAPLGVLNEDYEATVNRMALFAQDEWAITPRLQAYLGLRWEGLQTDVTGRGIDRVRNSSSVVSPVAQLLWKLPGAEKDQLRLALSRTYKAPETRLLVPRRYTINNGNSPTNPDVRGNPDLRPELAWGLDAGYEKFFGKDGMASVSAYVRRIEYVVVYALDPDLRPWLSAPSNKGHARMAGIEADTKFTPRRELDLRANLGYNWSELDAIPGPDNRLAEQVRVTSNLGLDYRPSPAWNVGANLNLQFAGAERISQLQRAYTGPRRSLDLYALWKTSEQTKWRLSVSDALQQDLVSRQSYDSGTGLYDRRFVQSSRMVLRLTLETRL